MRPAARAHAQWDGLFKGSFARSSELVGGLLLAFVSLLLLIALLSFSASDASFTTAAAGEPKNWIGVPGAWVASVLLLVIGWPAVLLSGSLARLAWRMIVGPERLGPQRRLWIGLIGVALVAIGLAIWENEPALNLTAGSGGIIGLVVEHPLDSLLAPLSEQVARAVRTLLSLTLVGSGVVLWWRSLQLRLPRVALPAIGFPVEEIDDDEVIEIDDAAPAGAVRPRRAVRAQAAAAPEISEAAAAPQQAQPRRPAQQGDMFAGSALPPLALLAPASGAGALPVDKAALERNARLLEGVLEDFAVKGQVTAVRQGPVVTMYELEPAPGTRASRVLNLADDIARNMSAQSARISPVPGRTVIGIELPNARTEPVVLHQLIASETFQDQQGQLPIVLGKNIAGDPVIADLAPMPHLLIAGTTGSGKSVGLNAMILSLLYRLTPDQCKLILIDPKMLELSVYDGIPHLLAPVVTEPPKAVRALKWAVEQMDDRYRAMANMQVRNLASYNEKVRAAKARGQSLRRQVQCGFDPETGQPIYEDEQLDVEPMPQIVVVVDELADLMMTAGKEVEVLIQRLAQKARAAGIHLILATQRPSVDVITGVIKANLPTRISFHVTSKIDSRTILGEQGAEQLLGKGDMLWMSGGKAPIRVHGPFVSDDEVRAVADHWRAQGSPDYVQSVTEEPEHGGDYIYAGEDMTDSAEDRQYNQAAQVVIDSQRASISSVQRALRIGYNTAARHIDRMESEGIISPPNHLGRREVLVDKAGNRRRARDDDD
ncbi:MAG: DNA translocase FtsK 4TM domain-containing protein [Proteobacteria bacterium]|nr:DNA translocase FtsK 4TM domain-containing protein [Pseudomonadota bacterium]